MRLYRDKLGMFRSDRLKNAKLALRIAHLYGFIGDTDMGLQLAVREIRLQKRSTTRGHHQSESPDHLLPVKWVPSYRVSVKL